MYHFQSASADWDKKTPEHIHPGVTIHYITSSQLQLTVQIRSEVEIEVDGTAANVISKSESTCSTGFS